MTILALVGFVALWAFISWLDKKQSR